jgi:hypothetical protein
MKRTLLISVAAFALAAASNMTFAQTSKPSGAGGASTNAPAANPTGAAPAGGGSSSTVNPTGDSQSTINETTPPGAHKGAQDTHKGAQDTTGPQKQQKQKSSQQAPAEKSGTQQSQGEQPRGERREQTQGEQPRGDRQQQTQSPQTGGSKQGAAERPMTSKNVSLTTEQKTTIRQKVLTSSAPRVTNVDFDIRIGTAVPRTVRVAPLPTTLIEIEPEWRGYMYFVSGDQIIVVEPGTLRIVAVLEV